MKLTEKGKLAVAYAIGVPLLVLAAANVQVKSGANEGFPESTVPVNVVGGFPCAEEDEVLVGVGDFDGGQWSGGWRCDARDDF